MGINCSVDKERGGRCTSYDGIIPEKITIPANTNGWTAHRTINEKIPCDSCKNDALDNFSGLQDLVNLSIGEIDRPYDEDNFWKFVDKVNKVAASLRHGVK